MFEKCVFKHLHNFIVTNRLISLVQSGLTPNDSAVFQLLDLYDTFTKAIDDGKDIRVIFCDISKAFDRVWHKGLLFKLRRIGVGISLLDWLRSYFGSASAESCIRRFLLRLYIHKSWCSAVVDTRPTVVSHIY